MTEIDVSGCEFKSCFDDECYSDVGSTENLNCKDNLNCYYRQLKRLEQENQELGKIIDCKNGTIASLAKVRDELKEENAKLKEKLDDIEYIISYCAINRKSCYFCKFDKECEGENKDLILKIIRGEE